MIIFLPQNKLVAVFMSSEANDLFLSHCQPKALLCRSFFKLHSLNYCSVILLQRGLRLEDLLRRFVCSETVDAVECHGCQQQQNTDDSTSSIRTTFIKRLTLGKVTLHHFAFDY